MTRLLIGNNLTEEIAGDLATGGPFDRGVVACGAQRMLWWARDGDVVVLPALPGDDYVRYVTGLTGTAASSLTFLAPPPGRVGPGVIAPEALLDSAFVDRVRAALTGRPPQQVLAIVPNPAVVGLARLLGAEEAVPGHHFHAQGGSAIINSKAAFRALAAGCGVPIAPGIVTADRFQAAEFARGLLAEGHDVMLKKEFRAGGFGNEVLTCAPDTPLAGAPRAVVVDGPAAVTAHLEDRWPWLTDAGRHRLVVERYFPGSVPGYAEFTLADEGVRLSGSGEMLMNPVVYGEIVPAQHLPAAAEQSMTEYGRRLCTVYFDMGYRGTIGTDALLTPAGEVMLCEANGRITGSTHIHTALATRLVGAEHRGQRVFLEADGLPAPSFRTAVDRLVAAELAFDPARRTGTVLVCDFTLANGTVTYCVISEDTASAHAARKALHRLAGHAAD